MICSGYTVLNLKEERVISHSRLLNWLKGASQPHCGRTGGGGDGQGKKTTGSVWEEGKGRSGSRQDSQIGRKWENRKKLHNTAYQVAIEKGKEVRLNKNGAGIGRFRSP